MNKSTQHPFRNIMRLVLIAALAVLLTLGTGQMAQAASTLAPVNLGKAATFVVLSKSGITNVPNSAITGDLGVSPIAATAITGFALVADSTHTFSNSSQVTGKVYAANNASPTPANLTTAVLNMQTAFTDGAGRKNPNFTNLYSGNLGGKTLKPGLYKWGTGVLVNSQVTLVGGSQAVWIFQIAGNLKLGSGARIVLSGGALAKNVFWVVSGYTQIGTTAHMEGTILDKTAIHFLTGASMNGRALAQTAVTLQKNVLVIKK
jgi:Ice-binding-like